MAKEYSLAIAKHFKLTGGSPTGFQLTQIKRDKIFSSFRS
jgi:hypothetical protein